MSNPETVETLAPTQNEATDAVAIEAQQTATEAADNQATGETPAKSPEQIELERLRRTLTKRERTMGALHREREELRQRLTQIEQAQPQGQTESVPDAEQIRKVIETEAERRASAIAEQRALNERCNAIAEAGKKKYADTFTTALKTVHEEAGGIFDHAGNATPVLSALMDADDPAAVINYLGTQPDLAASLEGLTPAKLGRRIAQIEAQMSQQPRPSAAPRTLAPLRSQSAESELSASMPYRQWEKLREAQIKERRGY